MKINIVKGNKNFFNAPTLIASKKNLQQIQYHAQKDNLTIRQQHNTYLIESLIK